MLTPEHNETLTRVGPGTPMGDLMRRYWHPVAAKAQLLEKKRMHVRLFGGSYVGDVERIAARLGVERAPFFVVRDDHGEAVYVSVLQLMRERFCAPVTAAQEAQTIDADDIGGI